MFYGMPRRLLSNFVVVATMLDEALQRF